MERRELTQALIELRRSPASRHVEQDDQYRKLRRRFFYDTGIPRSDYPFPEWKAFREAKDRLCHPHDLTKTNFPELPATRRPFHEIHVRYPVDDATIHVFKPGLYEDTAFVEALVTMLDATHPKTQTRVAMDLFELAPFATHNPENNPASTIDTGNTRQRFNAIKLGEKRLFDLLHNQPAVLLPLLATGLDDFLLTVAHVVEHSTTNRFDQVKRELATTFAQPLERARAAQTERPTWEHDPPSRSYRVLLEPENGPINAYMNAKFDLHIYTWLLDQVNDVIQTPSRNAHALSHKPDWNTRFNQTLALAMVYCSATTINPHLADIHTQIRESYWTYKPEHDQVLSDIRTVQQFLDTKTELLDTLPHQLRF